MLGIMGRGLERATFGHGVQLSYCLVTVRALTETWYQECEQTLIILLLSIWLSVVLFVCECGISSIAQTFCLRSSRQNPAKPRVKHVGTNSLRSSNTPRECAVELIDLAEAVSSESSAMISISGLINRSDDEALACEVPDVNKVLKECCKQKNWGFVDHSNISITSHLNRSGLHLNKKGTTRLAQNFINHLRVD